MSIIFFHTFVVNQFKINCYEKFKKIKEKSFTINKRR
jgi:hypothetical protein